MEIKYTIQGLLIYARLPRTCWRSSRQWQAAGAGRPCIVLCRLSLGGPVLCLPLVRRAACARCKTSSRSSSVLRDGPATRSPGSAREYPANRRPVGGHAHRRGRARSRRLCLQRSADAASAGPAKLAVRPARRGLHALLHFHGQSGIPGQRAIVQQTAPPTRTTLLPPEQATYELVTIGFPLLTLGLVLGSWWGKLAWGDYWGWDPKELWSLASWLVYIGYFHWRYMFGKLHPRINSLWAIAGMAAIIVTLVWVNLSRLFPGLHSYAT